MTGAPGMAAPRARDELTVCLVAGEESGDRLGAALMRALVRGHDGTVRFCGVGGRAMTAEGLTSLYPIDQHALMGFAAVVRQLPAILRRIRDTAAAIVAIRPHVLVIIDSPDFTLQVAKRVRAAAPGIPIVDYVSPTVWAWRPGRARAMRAYVDHVLAVLPFEPAVHERLGGPPCTYVGHPLVEHVGELRPSATETERRLADPPVLLVMPGSRRGEIRRFIEPFGQAIALVSQRVGQLELVVPTVPAIADDVRTAVSAWSPAPIVIDDPAGKHHAFRVARAALAKSGTGTLELALAGVPTVAAYRVAAWEAAILRLLAPQPSTIILANLVLGENVVPELLQEDCVPQKLAAALVPLLGPGPPRRRQLDAFARLDAVMEIGSAEPSTKAARIVLDVAARRRAPAAAGNP